MPYPTKTKTLFVVAGEASGDSLAAPVVSALLSGGGWRAVGIGGPKLADAGAALLYKAEELSLIGLFEVLPALPRVWRIWNGALAAAQRLRPDVALLIDMPDFNMRLGPKLAALGTKVIYVGAPQAWAWRPGRASGMGAWVHTLCCLFPFEIPFFQAAGVNALFVGHPRAEQALELDIPAVKDPNAPKTLVIMPGSRHAELRRHLPVLRATIPKLLKSYKDLEIKIPTARTLSPADISDALPRAANLSVVCVDALPLLAQATLAAVASGTATTEAMLAGTPAAVFYKVSPPTYLVLKHLVRVPWIAMPNLLAQKPLLPELIQHDFTPDRLFRTLKGLLDDAPLRANMRVELLRLAASLRAPKPFTHTIASLIESLP